MKNFSFRRKLSSSLFAILPLIISQRLRFLLYNEEYAIQESATFVRRSITGSLFTGNTRDLHAGKFAVHGFYDWRNVAIAKALRSLPGDIIEIGANIGTETVCFSDLVGEKGKVFAFEPFTGNLVWLKQNARLSKKQNIKVFPYAISDQTSIVEFRPPRDDHATGTGSIEITSKPTSAVEEVSVQCYRLDDLTGQFSVVKALFIDIEGADFLAIIGGQSLIARDHPVIVLEVSPKLMKEYGLMPEDVATKMAELGYKVFKIGKIRLTNADLNEQRHSNWICIPGESLYLKNKINRSIFWTAVLPTFLLTLLNQL